MVVGPKCAEVLSPLLKLDLRNPQMKDPTVEISSSRNPEYVSCERMRSVSDMSRFGSSLQAALAILPRWLLVLQSCSYSNSPVYALRMEHLSLRVHQIARFLDLYLQIPLLP